MARYLCKKACFWAKRRWDPKSPLEKNRVYNGDAVPPEGLFEALDGKAPKVKGYEPEKPIAMSSLLPVSPKVEGVDNPGNVPIVDGEAVDDSVLS